MKYLNAIIIVLFLVSCGNSSNDKQVYDLACDAVKEQLVSPSSAIFAKYDKNNKTQVVIIDTAGRDNPMMSNEDWIAKPDTTTELGKAQAELIASKRKYDGTPYSSAMVTVDYEASNRLGVMLKETKKVYLRKWLYHDNKPGDWEVIDIE